MTKISELPTAGTVTGSEQIPIVQDGVNKRVAINLTAVLESRTVATLPSSPATGTLRFVTDEVGGAVPAFFDGIDWRRTSSDRAVVS